MSDLPGTPRRNIDPAVIQDQLEKLTAQVTRLMESQQVAEKAPQPAGQHPKCFVIMPFGIQDLEDLYNEFILPVLDVCKLECARRALRSPASPRPSIRIHTNGLQAAGRTA
jgi:hypothetical protein